MRRLTVQQPWTELLVSGRKTVELRSWPTSYRGPVLLTSSKRHDPRGAAYGVIGECGVTCGVVELVDCRPATAEDRAAACVDFDVIDLWAWEVRGAYRVPAVPVLGSLGLRVVPDALLDALTRPPET